MKLTKTKSFMKKLLALTAVLAVAAGGLRVAHASYAVLYNGDLNLIGPGPEANPSPQGWNYFGWKQIEGAYDDMCDSESWCNGAFDDNQSGTGWGLFLKPFSGTTNPPVDLASCYFSQDNATFPGTAYTLSVYACGQAEYSGYQVGPPWNPVTALVVRFLDGSGNVLTNNQYDLIAAGLNNTGDPVPTVQFTTPSYKAPSGAVTVECGILMSNVWSTTGAQSLTVDDFDLEATAPTGAPVITTQPTGATAPLGGHASFTVAASPAPTAYSWTLNGGAPVGPEFSGTNSATLTINPVNANDIGHYQCFCVNANGGSGTVRVPLAINGINLFPTVILNGTLGDTYAIERSSTVGGPYTAFSTNKITVKPQYITDYTVPISPNEYYQEVFLH